MPAVNSFGPQQGSQQATNSFGPDSMGPPVAPLTPPSGPTTSFGPNPFGPPVTPPPTPPTTTPTTSFGTNPFGSPTTPPTTPTTSFGPTPFRPPSTPSPMSSFGPPQSPNSGYPPNFNGPSFPITQPGLQGPQQSYDDSDSPLSKQLFMRHLRNIGRSF